MLAGLLLWEESAHMRNRDNKQRKKSTGSRGALLIKSHAAVLAATASFPPIPPCVPPPLLSNNLVSFYYCSSRTDLSLVPILFFLCSSCFFTLLSSRRDAHLSQSCNVEPTRKTLCGGVTTSLWEIRRFPRAQRHVAIVCGSSVCLWDGRDGREMSLKA